MLSTMPVIRPNSALQGDKNVMSGLYTLSETGVMSKYVTFWAIRFEMPSKQRELGQEKRRFGDRESFPLIVPRYDPGGRGAHGGAVVSKQPDGTISVKVTTMSSVAQIFAWYTDQSVTAPCAGIDTLLSWPTTMRQDGEPLTAICERHIPLSLRA